MSNSCSLIRGFCLLFQWQYVLYLLVAWVIHFVVICLYRVTLHPLAKFPGPKLAGASYAYEFWFDVIMGGRYIDEIAKLHQLYGPIVRINPDQLNCNDSNFVSEIYASGDRKRNKPDYIFAGVPSWTLQGVQLTLDHSLHKMRRASINKFFSKSQIMKLENVIHRDAQKLCNKLLSYSGRGPFQAEQAYICFTTDVITEYCFGTSTGFLDQEDWKPNFHGSLALLTKIMFHLRHFVWLRRLLDLVPPRAIAAASSKLGGIMDLFATLPQQIENIRSTHSEAVSSEHPTIFSELLRSNLPESEKSTQRLSAEALAMLAGGTETLSSALSGLTYHLLANSHIYEQLRAELLTVVSDPANLPSWTTLYSLPYLSAVTLEGLRMMCGAVTRSPRIAPDEDLIYNGLWSPPDGSKSLEVCHVIPRGYAIGSSAILLHADESIFPKPSEFNPERWLNPTGQRRSELEKHLFTFSKGSRQCVGTQLAYCELYVCVTALTLRALPYMELYKTDRSDIDYDYDEGFGRPRRGSKGLRVVMKEL